MASSTSTTSTHILQQLLRAEPRQPPSTSISFRPVRPASRSTEAGIYPRRFAKIPICSSTASLFSTASLLLSSSHSFSSARQTAFSHEEEEEEGFGFELEHDSNAEGGEGGRLSSELKQNEVRGASSGEGKKRNVDARLPNLSVKEKKELASYAHGMGKKLKTQLVGKSGVTENVATSFMETLEANELLKIKIHGTCPGELEEVVQQLVKLTRSVVVSKIGRTVIIYRPSITKLKAEEKRRQERKLFERRQQNKPRFQPAVKAEQEPRTNGRGRRGSSRFTE